MSKQVLLYADDLERAIAEVEAEGGMVIHVFVPAAFVAVFPSYHDENRLQLSSTQKPHRLNWKSRALADAWVALQNKKQQESQVKETLAKEELIKDAALKLIDQVKPDPEKTGLKTHAHKELVKKGHNLPPKAFDALDEIAHEAGKLSVKGVTHEKGKLEKKRGLLIKHDNTDKKLVSKKPANGSVSWNTAGYEEPASPENDENLRRLAEDSKELLMGPSGYYMKGKIAVGLVVVNSTIAEYQITSAQDQQIIQETLQGTDFLTTQNPNAGIQFIYDLQNPTVSVPAGSLTVWQTSLPGCGYAVTSVVLSGQTTYAGCNGYVYALDGNGNVSAQNGLSGMGNHEVRLDIGTQLLTGTNGYALGLDPVSLNTLWQTSLPGCGYAVTSVLANGSTYYAGCNGYVYQLDTNGNVNQQNGLPGMGNNEVRLALGAGMLIVGTNGYVLGLDPNSLNTLWQTSLPGCGYAVTNVLVSGSTIYAGCNGYVYALNTSGAVTAQNGLSGMGNNEVRLTMSNSSLIIGTNGYALALDPNSLNTLWQTSLPGCGYAVTSVAVDSWFVYAGCNGYIYQLNSNGSVSYANNLPGLGNNEVRLSAGSGGVSAGTNGYALQTYVGSPYSAYEDPWRNAAMAQMGYAPNLGGVSSYVNHIENQYGADFGYAAFFTQYPLNHFAYQYSVLVVMNYSNDGWGPDAINQVFAHETCHVFGAADEYGSCSCGGSYGYLGVPNNNCATCSGTQVDCLMDGNSLTLCEWSRGQIGWTYFTQGVTTSLPDCGYNITDVALSGTTTYAGCNGYLYIVDANGNVTAQNGLSGMGNNEVRVSVGASQLLLGTNGYALGLDLSSANTLWQTSLPGCGYAVTSVLANGSTYYAGCNGYVYLLDTSGNVNAQNGLPGMGNNEVRLALGAGLLIVGTNGYVLGLDPNSLNTLWQTSLPGCGYAVTSVIVSGNTIYAGCNGYVYALDTNGNVTAQNGLSGMGNNEVRLAVCQSLLIAGTNGYALGLDGTSLNTNWQTSLPGCGYNVTSVNSQGNYVFAGSNGYFYALTNAGGVVAYTSNMPGTGNSQVRMAVAGNQISVGTNGYTVIFAMVQGVDYSATYAEVEEALLEEMA